VRSESEQTAMTSISSDPAALMNAAALRIATLSEQAIAKHGRFTFVLSGGSTPRQLYELLASDEFVSMIEWSRVDFFWGDERCVAPDHPDSNYRMARESLLDAIEPDPARVHRMLGEETPARAAAAYEAMLHAFFAVAPHGPPPSFDLVLFGMGADGHTASLFPGTAALDETERWVVPNRASRAGMPGMPRLTLTFPILNAASNSLFLVTGADKAERVKQVLEHTPGSEALPASRIRPTHGQLEWMIDAAAASRLERA
jgi:6-phosphogluconolactonase